MRPEFDTLDMSRQYLLKGKSPYEKENVDNFRKEVANGRKKIKRSAFHGGGGAGWVGVDTLTRMGCLIAALYLLCHLIWWALR